MTTPPTEHEENPVSTEAPKQMWAVSSGSYSDYSVHVLCATEAEAEAQLIAFLTPYVAKGASPMCGNSIGQDRRFLVKYMPKLEAFVHYRNVDVSTLKELAKRWKPGVAEAFKKQQKHTALADVHESIEELAHYRTHFLKLD